jgi:hypothetical protein
LFDEISVFRIDMESKPSMRLITKASKHRDIEAYCAEGNLLAFVWFEGEPLRQRVTFRKMALSPDEVERDVMMDIDIFIKVFVPDETGAIF